jgi:putative DNA primase/helicase
MTTAVEIGRRLSLHRNGSGYSGRCPCCGYQGAFTVADRCGMTLVRCYVGCEQRDVIDALRHQGLWPRDGDRVVSSGLANAARTAAVEPTSATDRALSLWGRGASAVFASLASADPLGRYLAHRGYVGPIPRSLRFLSNVLHRPTETRWPAMLAAVTREPSGAVVAVHRTYLRPDGTGKAPVRPAKMALGSVSGGAIRLAPAAERLAVTEGIETGLSVLAATGVATWAALSAGGIRWLDLPPLPLAADVVICADHDPVGLAAAEYAAERWSLEGRTVRIATPPGPGQDFNDLATGVVG